MSAYSFNRYMDTCRERVDHLLASNTLDRDVSYSSQVLSAFAGACKYSLNNGGKRVRPLLVYASARACGYPEADLCLDRLSCAMELIHCYSLTHDDLPAMDDDDMRRGKPSVHKAYDEATAILVGDSLQARAFELIANAPELSAEQKIKMIKVLAHAAGREGMVGGQYIDIQATGTDMALEELRVMHSMKTGALIRASVIWGGIAADATEEQLAALGEYGIHIGLAFQVADDVLDIEGDSDQLGKTQGKDAKTDKATYPRLLGLKGAKTEAQRLLRMALEAIDGFGDSADRLRELAHYIVERNR